MFASFFISPADGHALLSEPIGVDVDEKHLYNYLEGGAGTDYSRSLFSSGRSMIYKESEIFPKEKVEHTDYYINVYKPVNITDSVTLSVANQGIFLGVITIFRNGDMPEFTEEELFMLELLMPHLESKLSNEYLAELHKNSSRKTVNIENAKQKYILTERECEVLKLLLAGNAVSEICEMCSISDNTLRKHTMNIYRKTDVHSRNELVKLFYK